MYSNKIEMVLCYFYYTILKHTYSNMFKRFWLPLNILKIVSAFTSYNIYISLKIYKYINIKYISSLSHTINSNTFIWRLNNDISRCHSEWSAARRRSRPLSFINCTVPPRYFISRLKAGCYMWRVREHVAYVYVCSIPVCM